MYYPIKEEDVNFNIIRILESVFVSIKIGYSNYTLPDETMTILTTAYLLGAEIIERHFALDKTLPGNDHHHAGDSLDFRKAIENFKRVRKVLGSFEKTVFSCKEIPRREAGRPLVLNREMKCEEIITERDIIAKRPGTGRSPKYIDLVLDRKIKCDLEEDTTLIWAHT